MYFFSGGPEPPLINFDVFHREKMCPPEEIKAPPLKSNLQSTDIVKKFRIAILPSLSFLHKN